MIGGGVVGFFVLLYACRALLPALAALRVAGGETLTQLHNL